MENKEWIKPQKESINDRVEKLIKEEKAIREKRRKEFECEALNAYLEDKGIDPTNHPNYYNVNGYECWQVMETLFGKQACALARLTNAFEYIWRSPRKGVLIQDLRKAKHELELSDEDLDLIDKYYQGVIEF